MIKSYITSKNNNDQEFALYIMDKNFLKVIDFCALTEFKSQMLNNTQLLKDSIYKENTQLGMYT